MGDLTKSFSKHEFACDCCGYFKDTMQFRRFVKLLQYARDATCQPFIINSGFRCKQNNKDIGGSPDSAHLSGIAADIKTSDSTERFKILRALITCGFSRIGIYDAHIHVDVDYNNKPNKIIWKK
jgi:zinc D-Ala-D-Ala carboxypeptidase